MGEYFIVDHICYLGFISFVAQVTGMDVLGPFTFNAARSFVAVISLGILVLILKDNYEY